MKKRWLGLKAWAGADMFLEEHEQGEGGLNLSNGITSSFSLMARRLHVGRGRQMGWKNDSVIRVPGRSLGLGHLAGCSHCG